MTVTPISDRDYLHRPLKAGGQITYWQLGTTGEERYDVPDQPMKGEMDPFFFLTKHKNFIPHEYPCRTAFAKERRGKRPQVKGSFALSRFWLPFGSPRVDLSGFWFRPTVIDTWARTVVSAKSAGEAVLRLGTCGGAVIFINGREIGWMADYVRNLEAKQEFKVELAAGANEIMIFFDDLAERDARYFFQLDYVSGPMVEQALPVPVEAKTAAELEAALDRMHFEKPAYRSGEVALTTSAPISAGATARVTIAGDFMSREEPMRVERRLEAGETRVMVGKTEALPSDFRHFHVDLSVGDFTASRVFGVEICHAERQGKAPEALKDRIREALDEISDYGEPDNVTALARLGSGRFGAETDRMIADTLPTIMDCHDCADFALVPLLWCRWIYKDDIAPEVVAKIDEAILSYRYWMDEPGNDVQWYFSENHALLFHTAAYLAGALHPEARFVRSGRLGKEQSATGLERVRAWLDHFEKWEMAEFNSAPYFPIDLKGLTALSALAPDQDVRTRATTAIRRLITIVARSAHHGILTGAQGRSYEHTLRAAGSLELSGIARLIWGNGNFGRRVHALPQMALCLRDHGLDIPADLADIADWQKDTAQEWCFAQGQDRIARLYHYKTGAYSIGTAAHYRWNEWGYQETVLHLRLGTDPDAQVWVNHPGETIHSGYGRPSYWGGSGSLPRLWHYRGLAVMMFACGEEQPDFTHAWFPRQVFDASSVEGDLAIARSGKGLLMLKGSGPLTLVEEGPTAGNEIRLAGRKGMWIVRLGATQNEGSDEEFASRFSGLTVTEGDADTFVLVDPDYGPVTLYGDGRVAAEGRVIDPSQWSVEGHAAELPLGPLGRRG
ncbi:hypothetical protein [Roseibium salinum]|uniref:Alpha-L-rhamnosidase six-hairpin glycosidase domain-containing protein n=1 Tax=Roseibium salinum TaxID=1604349 RepID=A0ABT3QX57_9HYPH|nr:hypothetical protein [Roseibium sp. DSM 29163]MCX2721502.1 hypothetical protein [Roseibium sp. DSM 29163]